MTSAVLEILKETAAAVGFMSSNLTLGDLVVLLGFLLTGAGIWFRLGGLQTAVEMWSDRLEQQGQRLSDHSSEIKEHSVALIRIEKDTHRIREVLDQTRIEVGDMAREVKQLGGRREGEKGGRSS